MLRNPPESLRFHCLSTVSSKLHPQALFYRCAFYVTVAVVPFSVTGTTFLRRSLSARWLRRSSSEISPAPLRSPQRGRVRSPRCQGLPLDVPASPSDRPAPGTAGGRGRRRRWWGPAHPAARAAAAEMGPRSGRLFRDSREFRGEMLLLGCFLVS